MKDLILPAIKGKFGDWIYFIATMKLSEVANKARISSVSEIAELYPKSINDVLQRELDSKRINKIATYLKDNDDRFLSSLIVAIFKGNPTWSDIKIEEGFKIDKKEVDDEKLNYARGRLGLLTLNGDETIFALDGQHRLNGIREAFKTDKALVENDDVSIVFIVHNTKLKERTRRLFTILNRYAEKPKKAELIIMEEDDAAAILTRKLVMEHEIFKLPNSISKTRDLAIPPSDLKSFSSLVCLYEIHKFIIDFKKLYPGKIIKRPNAAALKKMYESDITEFWDFIFESFTELEPYISGTLDDDNFKRNKDTGGSLILRPEVQILIADLYSQFKKKGAQPFKEFKAKLPKIDWNLSNPIWKYIFWNAGRMNPKNKPLKRKLILFLLGEPINKQALLSEINKFYEDFKDDFDATLLKPVK